MTAVADRQRPISGLSRADSKEPLHPVQRSAWREVLASPELFVNLTLRELRSKYKRSWLGWGWSMVNPLALTAIYTIVFAHILRIGPQPGVNGITVFALWLLCGLLPWNFFQTAVMSAIGSITGNGNLIQKSYFPRQLLPLSAVAGALVSHFIEMALLVLALVAFGDYQAVYFLPMTFVMIMVMVVFATGLGLLLGVANVFFRDVQYFMSIFFLAWLYLTPLVYPATLLHGTALFLIKLNPMTDASIALRDGLYYGSLPSPLDLGAIVTAALVTFAVGWTVFAKYENRIVEEL